MTSSRFEIEHWTSLIRLDTIRRQSKATVGGRPVTGPFDIAVVEQLRQEALHGTDPGPAAATDVFIFGLGEAPRREMTKIGGVPYRSATLEWPRTDDGQPYSFVAQLNFRESRDLVTELPGDILLVFASEPLPRNGMADAFHFEWHSVGIDDLISAEDCPTSTWHFVPCYGLPYRTDDYPEGRHCFADYKQGWLLQEFEGTKIGGSPVWIQRPTHNPGEFFASLGSVEPTLVLEQANSARNYFQEA